MKTSEVKSLLQMGAIGSMLVGLWQLVQRPPIVIINSNSDTRLLVEGGGYGGGWNEGDEPFGDCDCPECLAKLAATPVPAQVTLGERVIESDKTIIEQLKELGLE